MIGNISTDHLLALSLTSFSHMPCVNFSGYEDFAVLERNMLQY
jgi:hypothetical protein